MQIGFRILENTTLTRISPSPGEERRIGGGEVDAHGAVYESCTCVRSGDSGSSRMTNCAD